MRYRVEVPVIPREHQLMINSERFLFFDCRVGENERILGFSFKHGTNFWLITSTSKGNQGKTPATALCALLRNERSDTYAMFLGEMFNRADQVGDNYGNILTDFK